MTYFIYLHLFTILPCLFLGSFILLRYKGDLTHKKLGKLWAYLMIISSVLSFGIRGKAGFSWLHGLAIYTIFSILIGIRSAQRGDIASHRGSMIGTYIGSWIAFFFALSKNRLLGDWVRGWF